MLSNIREISATQTVSVSAKKPKIRGFTPITATLAVVVAGAMGFGLWLNYDYVMRNPDGGVYAGADDDLTDGAQTTTPVYEGTMPTEFTVTWETCENGGTLAPDFSTTPPWTTASYDWDSFPARTWTSATNDWNSPPVWTTLPDFATTPPWTTAPPAWMHPGFTSGSSHFTVVHGRVLPEEFGENELTWVENMLADGGFEILEREAPHYSTLSNFVSTPDELHAIIDEYAMSVSFTVRIDDGNEFDVFVGDRDARFFVKVYASTSDVDENRYIMGRPAFRRGRILIIVAAFDNSTTHELIELLDANMTMLHYSPW
jgi:hypothetical protein